jgi:hypothetical protein
LYFSLPANFVRESLVASGHDSGGGTVDFGTGGLRKQSFFHAVHARVEIVAKDDRLLCCADKLKGVQLAVSANATIDALIGFIGTLTKANLNTFGYLLKVPLD